MTWADRADFATIIVGIVSAMVALLAVRYARRSNSIARDAIDRRTVQNAIADRSNEIAEDALREVRRSNELQLSAQETQAVRDHASGAAVLALDHLHANWDTEWLPEMSLRLSNRGAATAYDVRYQMLETAPDRYGQEIGRPLAIPSGNYQSYFELRPKYAVYRDATTVIVQIRIRYQDGHGPHVLTVRIGVVFHQIDQHHGNTTVGIVFATLDDSDYDEIPVDRRFGTFVDM